MHSSVANSGLSIIGSLLYNNFASFGGGVYVGDYHAGVSVHNTTFQHNVGAFGAALYITQFNYDIVFKTAIIKDNEAFAEGGGIYVLAADITMLRSTLINNMAPGSGGIYSEAQVVHIELCVIADNSVLNLPLSSQLGLFGGAYFTAASSVMIIATEFINNSAGSGGAVGVSRCEDVFIWNCTFKNNVASYTNGGAVVALASNLNVSNCSFHNNSASNNGGAIQISGVARRINVLESVFDENVVSTGSGSAVWVSSPFNISIVGNVLLNNRALNGGGTIYWTASAMTEPAAVLTGNYFADSNEALYGSNVATDAWALSLNTANVYNITDYSKNIPPLIIYVVDYYDQVVRTESTAYLSASVLSRAKCYAKSSGYVTGGIIETVVGGMANFSSLLVYCDPGYSMLVDMTSSIDGITLQTSFKSWFRECVTGEYWSDRVCAPCEVGTYSVTDPSTILSLSELTQQQVCQACPDGASTCYGDTVVLEEGYWRISQQATSTMSCPYEGSCGGGEGTGDALCSDGYEGKYNKRYVISWTLYIGV